MSLGWILSRARDVHGGFDYMAKIFRAMHTRSELLICCYYLRFVFATRVRALHSASDEYRRLMCE